MIVHPVGALTGVARVPGDKSVTHRALLLGAIARGVTEIVHPGTGADNLSTLSAIRALGVEATFDDAEHFTVRGAGMAGLRRPETPIDCGNSGTTARLLAGLLAGAGVEATLVGDASLSARPMGRVADPLRDLGYALDAAEGDTLPLRIGSSRPADEPARAVLNVASAQVKSCILLSGLYRGAPTEVVEPAVSRDHTERMLRALGVRCTSSADDKAPMIRLDPPEEIVARSLEVPGDLSSAAFIVSAGLLTGGEVRVERVGTNPTRAGFLAAIEQMGATVRHRKRIGLSSGEPAADLVTGGGSLSGTTLGGGEIPLLIDEVPVLAVLGAAASGTFEVRDAAELRVKESDRVARTVELLAALGVEAEEREDGLTFPGRGSAAWPAFAFDCGEDHRIAMAAVVAALAAEGPCELSGVDCVAVSFPSFFETLAALGARFEGAPEAT